MSRLYRTILALSMAFAVLAPVAVARSQGLAAGTPLDKNLVRNPNAERVTGEPDGYKIVNIPGWVRVGNFTAVPYGVGGFPSVDKSKAFGGGKYFFSGGPDNSSSRAYQVRAIRDLVSQVDGGSLKLNVVAWLAGWDGQRDSARVVVEFLDGANRTLGSVRTVAVSATSEVFMKKTASAVVPKGTRKLKISLVAARGDGAYNDGYFDKLDVRLVNR